MQINNIVYLYKVWNATVTCKRNLKLADDDITQ